VWEIGWTYALPDVPLLQLLGAIGDGRGVLVVLEDLHWADPETRDVVDYLVDNLGDQPVLCVMTTRLDAHAAVPERLGALVVRGSASLLEARPSSAKARMTGRHAVEDGGDRGAR
jgi:hypothetical protein